MPDSLGDRVQDAGQKGMDPTDPSGGNAPDPMPVGDPGIYETDPPDPSLTPEVPGYQFSDPYVEHYGGEYHFHSTDQFGNVWEWTRPEDDWDSYRFDGLNYDSNADGTTHYVTHSGGLGYDTWTDRWVDLDGNPHESQATPGDDNTGDPTWQEVDLPPRPDDLPPRIEESDHIENGGPIIFDPDIDPPQPKVEDSGHPIIFDPDIGHGGSDPIPPPPADPIPPPAGPIPPPPGPHQDLPDPGGSAPIPPPPGPDQPIEVGNVIPHHTDTGPIQDPNLPPPPVGVPPADDGAMQYDPDLGGYVDYGHPANPDQPVPPPPPPPPPDPVGPAPHSTAPTTDPGSSLDPNIDYGGYAGPPRDDLIVKFAGPSNHSATPDANAGGMQPGHPQGGEPPIAQNPSTEPALAPGSGDPNAHLAQPSFSDPTTTSSLPGPTLHPDLLDPTAPGPTLDHGLVDQIQQDPQLVNAVNQNPDIAHALEQDPHSLGEVAHYMGLTAPQSPVQEASGVVDPSATTSLQDFHDPSLVDPGHAEPSGAPDHGVDDHHLHM